MLGNRRSYNRRMPSGLRRLELRVSGIRVVQSSFAVLPGSGPAKAAGGLAAVFIGITCWWLTQDRSVPLFDAGSHLGTAIFYHDLLRSGDLLGPLNYSYAIYPPLTFLVGAAAAFIGGVNVAAPILGQNVVYVPMLVVGCYQTGRLVYGARAGLLAVIFALGSPLLIEQFHVFMLDAPQAALVALSVWLILATGRFGRVGPSALAGLVAGFGIASKEQFPFFIVGLVIVVLMRDHGWRNWRGLVTFVVVAVIVACPWYVRHLSDLGTYAAASLRFAKAHVGDHPPLVSASNLWWYFWAVLNGLLFAPLFSFAAVGAVLAVVRSVRRSGPEDLTLELLGGCLGAWLCLTVTPVHDIRYTLPLLVYLAVLGTAWIARRGSVTRKILTGALLLVVGAATLGSSFGVGHRLSVDMYGDQGELLDRGAARPDRVVVYSSHDYLVSGPTRDGDVLAMLKALRSQHVSAIAWLVLGGSPAFDATGLIVLARIANLPILQHPRLSELRTNVAFLIHLYGFGRASPCVRLSDGTGVWVRLGNPAASGARDYCPLRRPQLYGP
jgi:Dolichyl-phosphate-mannose-protein mannosyltransferase